MWTRLLTTPGVIGSLSWTSADSLVLCLDTKLGPSRSLSRVLRATAGGVVEALRDETASFSCPREAAQGYHLLRSVNDIDDPHQNLRELLLMSLTDGQAKRVGPLRRDAIAYQVMDTEVTCWNTLFVFRMDPINSESHQLNNEPDDTLRYRRRVFSKGGMAAFARKTRLILRHPDGRRSWVALSGQVRLVEPHPDLDQFTVIVEGEASYSVFTVTATAEKNLGELPIITPAEWRPVSIEFSALSVTIVIREVKPVLKTYGFLSLQDGKWIAEDISGLKNFTGVSGTATNMAAARIDLIKGESEVWIRSALNKRNG